MSTTAVDETAFVRADVHDSTPVTIQLIYENDPNPINMASFDCTNTPVFFLTPNQPEVATQQQLAPPPTSQLPFLDLDARNNIQVATVPPKKKKKKPDKSQPPRDPNEKKIRKKLFKPEWMNIPAFRGWLKPCLTDRCKGSCCWCEDDFVAAKIDIQKHSRTQKHKDMVVQQVKKSRENAALNLPASDEPQLTHEEMVVQCEMRMAKFFQEHHVPQHVMDHLVILLKSICPDSVIIKDVKTKATVDLDELLKSMKSCENNIEEPEVDYKTRRNALSKQRREKQRLAKMARRREERRIASLKEMGIPITNGESGGDTTVYDVTDAEQTDCNPTSAEEDANDDDRSRRRKKKYRKKLFQEEWLFMADFEGWLQPLSDDEYKCKCVACDCEIQCGKSELQKHGKSRKHRQNVEMGGVRREELVKPIEDDLWWKQKKKHEVRVKECEIKLASFFAEHNIAFMLVDDLIPLLKTSIPDSAILRDIKMMRKKCTHIIENILAKVAVEEVSEILKQEPFSIFVDESSDVTKNNFLCIVVRYVCPMTRLVNTRLLELVALDATDCFAIQIYNKFKQCMVSKDIPLNNIIGLACDVSSVMIGENSFSTYLKNDSPRLVLLSSICHSASLVANIACEVFPIATEDLMEKIATYTSASSKHNPTFAELQEFLKNEKNKTQKSCITRWLSKYSCITRMLDHWVALENFFRVALHEDRLKGAEFVLNELGNITSKAYFYYLKYALSFFNEFSALFQSKKPLIPVLYDRSLILLKNIGQNFLTPVAMDHIREINFSDPGNLLTFDEIYMGPECEELLKRMFQNDILQIKTVGLRFYITAATEIRKRLPVNDPFFKEMKFLLPSVALKFSFRSEVRDLYHLANHFGIDTNKLSLEWRTLPNFFPEEEVAVLSRLEIDAMWCEISKATSVEDEPQFPNLSLLSKLVLSLPHSNAEVDKIFNIISEVKTKKRNRIRNNAYNGMAVVRSMFQDSNCFNFAVTETHLKLHNKDDLYKY